AAPHAQIVVNFRPVPHPIFSGPNRPNQLVIKLQPEDGLELQLQAAKGGLPGGSSESLSPVSLDLDFEKAFPSERVGAYERLVLSDPRSFASMPVSELAERSHVSKPTVVRFCRSVGYDGLADFKLKLAGTVNEGVPFVHRSVDEDDGPGELIVKVIDNAVSAM